MSNELLNLSAITSPLDSGNTEHLALINQGMEQSDSLIVPFQQQLINSSGSSVKSVLGGSYNFYHDLVSKNIGTPLKLKLQTKAATKEKGIGKRLKKLFKPADKEGSGQDKQEQTWQFDTLDKKITERAVLLLSLGASKGDIIALIDLEEQELVINVLAALKLGCIFTIFCQLSETLFNIRRDMLKHQDPKNVGIRLFVSEKLITDKDEQVLYEKEKKSKQTSAQVNQNKNTSTEVPLIPHVYNASDIVCINFDEDATESCQPWFQEAQSFYQSLLLNGLCLFGTNRQYALIIPNTCKLHYQVSLYLTAFLYGVHCLKCDKGKLLLSEQKSFCWVLEVKDGEKIEDKVKHFEKENKKNKPINGSIYLILLNEWELPAAPLPEILLADIPITEQFIHRLKFACPLNGFTLLGKHENQGKNTVVYSVPGRPYHLADMSNLEQKSEVGVGLYAICFSAEQWFVSNCRLTEAKQGYLYYEMPDFDHYPKQFISVKLEAYLKTERETQCWLKCYFLPQHIRQDHKIRLLIFYGDTNTNSKSNTNSNTKTKGKYSHQENKQWIKDTCQSWFDTCGCSDLFPDELVVFYCFPRDQFPRDKALSKPDWTHLQYLTNAFEQKEMYPVFHLISQYRYRLNHPD